MISEKNWKYIRFYLISSATSLVVIFLIQKIWPEAIPFQLFQLWKVNGSIQDVLISSWPLFAVGLGIKILVSPFIRKSWIYYNPEEEFKDDVVTSIRAGIFEEIRYRWLLFYIAIFTLKLTNFLLFGFAGFGLNQWLYTYIAGPFTDFTSFKLIHHLLFGDYDWAVGAAIIATNAKFRDGHAYQGPIGILFAWYAGLYFIYIVLTFGIIPAMIIHTLYDLSQDVVLYVIRKIKG